MTAFKHPLPIRRALIPGALFSLLALSACNTSAIRIPGLNNNQNRGNRAAAVNASEERITVATGAIENRVIGTGKVTAREILDVPFLRTGQILTVSVSEGDTVKAGQVLFELDSSDLENTARLEQGNYLAAQAAYSDTLDGPTAAELKAAQAQLNSAYANYNALSDDPTESELAAAQADLQTAEASLRQAQAAYDRRAARDPGVAASGEALSLETATNNYQKAKANYDAKFEKPRSEQVASASAAIANAQRSLDALKPVESQILQAQLKMDQAWQAWQTALKNVGYTRVRAPIDGLITSVNAGQGEWAGNGQAAVQIADFATPVFEVQLDEIDLGAVRVGQDARILLQSYPDQPINAKVIEIGRVGVSGGNAVTYKVTLELNADASRPEVLINMSGTGEIVISRSEDTVLVPARALVINTTDQSYSVLRVTQRADGQEAVRSVPVEIGARNTDNVQILNGLSAGDVLAIPIARTQTSTAGGPAGGGPPPGP
jgi:RND family efflux transporter MFP subunit